jgi:hypothetical protein
VENDELLFLQLVSMFQVAAMQQMGKLIDPATNEAHRALSQAKISIDTLDMLKEKTKGNLSDDEQAFLDKVLFELHMNFVEEQKRPSDAAADGDETQDARGDEPTATSAPSDEKDAAGGSPDDQGDGETGQGTAKGSATDETKRE